MFQECYQQLVQKLVSLKKSVKRAHSKEYLVKYEREAYELLGKWKDEFASAENLLDKFVQEAALDRCDQIYAEIVNIIRVKRRKLINGEEEESNQRRGRGIEAPPITKEGKWQV